MICLVDIIERDLYVYGRGAKVYRRYLKTIGYDRRKGLSQLESIQIPPEVKETIKSVEPKVKRYKQLIPRAKEDPSIVPFGGDWLGLTAEMYLVEWRGWRDIAKYEPKFAAKIPWYINM